MLNDLVNGLRFFFSFDSFSLVRLTAVSVSALFFIRH